MPWDEEAKEDLARLAVLVRKVSEFAIASAGAYYFFAYGMSIIGFMFISITISYIYQVSIGIAAIIGLILGVLLATALTAKISGPMWRYLASLRLTVERSRSWLGFLAFILGFIIAYSPIKITPGWYPTIAWYPGLGVAFILASMLGKFIEKDPYYTLMSLSGALLIATSPLTLYLASRYGPGIGNVAASGLILIIYLITGSYAMRRASKAFEEA